MSTSERAVEQGRRSLSWPAAVVITLAAAVLGLPAMLFDFPSFPSSFASIGWKIGIIAIMVVAVRLLENRRPTATDVGLLPVAPKSHPGRVWIALPAVIALTLVAMNWGEIPGLRELAGAGSGSSYEAGRITGPLLLFELLVRYPIGVVAEEMFFRGYLQPRLRVAAPIVAGVLFAVYHLQQWETIPSLIPFGIALGVLRWWLGSIWPGVAFHYAGNAMFILSLR